MPHARLEFLSVLHIVRMFAMQGVRGVIQVTDSVFSSNVARRAGGAGLFVTGASGVVIIACTFEGKA